MTLRAPDPKRGMDVIASAAGLALLSPAFTAISIAILLDDGRPVFYRQERVGIDGRPFMLWKFRTMRSGTDLLHRSFPPEAAITRTGKLLRRTSLDEIPQLINILRGEMSLVGPRPALSDQADRYTDEQRKRLAVLPGLTGPSQIKYRNSAKLSTRIIEDVHYVRSRTFFGDLVLLAKTVPAVLFGTGIVAGQTAADVDDLRARPSAEESGEASQGGAQGKSQ